VWGGASAVGQYAIQLAKASGFTVITTASPKNFPLMLTLGADAIYDYRDLSVVNKIKAYAQDKLMYAIDCISWGETPKLVSDCLCPGGFIAQVLPYEVPRKDIKGEFGLVFTLLGRVFLFLFDILLLLPIHLSSLSTFLGSLHTMSIQSIMLPARNTPDL
jgi:NADPH:quinone reductase-like Zn-dependent oxidoreductase